MQKKHNKLKIFLDLVYYAALASLILSDGPERENNIPKIVAELNEQDDFTFNVFDSEKRSGRTLSIIKKENTDSNEILEDTYKNISKLLKNPANEIDSLDIVGVGKEIDFTKLPIDDIENLEFSFVEDNFDFNQFKDLYPSMVDISSITQNSKLLEFLKDGNLEYADICISGEDKEILDYLSNNNIDIRKVTASIYQKDKEAIDALSKVSAKNIEINILVDSDSDSFDIDMDLNYKINDVKISFSSLVEEQNLKLGKLNINSNNENLNIEIEENSPALELTINENTFFHFPNQSIVTLSNVLMTNLEAIGSLENVSFIEYDNNQGISFEYENNSLKKEKVKVR